MLLEIDIRDFAIIEHLRVRFTPGFNVLTGETGAGKSIVVDAVGQLLGERADMELVRAGAERAVVEGLFEPIGAEERLRPVLEAYGVEPEAVLILSREIHESGRSTARINGRAVPVRALAEVGQLLVDVHGQSENTSLKREAEHIGLLDRYAGLEPERAALATLVTRESEAATELGRLRTDEEALTRRAELLAFQVDEVAAARLDAGEEEALNAERTRLANAERLARLADEAYTALRGGSDEEAAALDLVEVGAEALAGLAQIDPALEGLREAVVAAAEAIGDAAREALEYRDGLEFSPERLEEVEDRLAAISDLKRKYGGDVAAVLATGERAAAELAEISGSEERILRLTAEREALLAEIGALAGTLSARRGEAGERLARAVEVELAALGMPGSRFEVALERRPDPDGAPVEGERYAFDARGIDRVAFLVSTNPGEPPRPLARVASGGETARIMLALKSILSAADQIATLIFDEIDAGIGGRVGAVVGQKLWSLADRHQVLCVTHLPQVAAFGDTHFHVRKAVADGRTTTHMGPIVDGERAEELMLMLGSPTPIARENAQQLLHSAEGWKVAERGRDVSAAGS